jgi:hypothetical protein
MPAITKTVSVAANTTVENAIAGNMHEFLYETALVRIGLTASAAGVKADIIVGGIILGQAEDVSVTTERTVRDPHDMKYAARTSGRIVIQLRNTTASAITVNIYIDITFG